MPGRAFCVLRNRLHGRPRIREALRSGFMPIMNSIAAIGLVSLPG
ncbi:ABC transporter permease [Bradyrhizobium liaoningense]|nr:ABC transporter permease [Bradyrhizobium liaoningense]MBR1003922.1 ABC transporter permease [Bradyrhizobium liaoningense]MBR1032882.1 ABC transporter permease [Bradyrhizobium liaoningense]